MPSNPDPQPWAPDSANTPGTPPGLGVGGVGERGTASFAGNSTYNADYSLAAPTAPPRGPAVGTAYYSKQFPQQISSGAGTTSKRESAGT